MGLGDSRRASGAANEAGRRAIGAANEAARRAGGAAMEASRRGQQVVEDINALAAPPRQRRSLPSIDPVGSVPARRGSGVYKAPASSTGGGIASPLTEVTKTIEENGQNKQVADRVHYAPKTISSPDGLVTMRISPIKTLSMTDANGSQVTFEFAQS